MTERATPLRFDFYQQRPLTVEFSDLDLSSDAGILLARQAEERLQICLGLSECIQEWRDPDKIIHSLYQLVSQRIYQMVGGYEDASESNFLRHDPIYKIACDRWATELSNLCGQSIPTAFSSGGIPVDAHFASSGFGYTFGNRSSRTTSQRID